MMISDLVLQKNLKAARLKNKIHARNCINSRQREIQVKIVTQNSFKYYNHDIYIRPETIQTDFLPLARTSKEIDLESGDWRGLLESDLPAQLQRKQINKKN